MEELSGLDADRIKLPPGFRFHPTDEELITHYLSAKVLDCSFIADAIGQVDLNKVEPWDLPWKAKMGGKELYFFCLRDRKYPTGLRTNRATDAGYWKATGKDKEIFRAKILIGLKKTLVFYGGRAPRGEKTDWIMHEYRLEGSSSLCNLPKTAQNEWVVCRIFKKSSGGKKLHTSGFVNMTNYEPDSTSSDNDLSQSMEMSSNENYTKRFLGAELSHSTCFSSPMEGHRQNFLHELSSSPLRNSDFWSQNSIFTSQALIIPRAEKLHDPDSHALIQDQSMLIRDVNLIADSEFSHDTGMNTDIYAVFGEDEFKPLQDQDFAPISPCPVDPDCSWDC